MQLAATAVVMRLIVVEVSALSIAATVVAAVVAAAATCVVMTLTALVPTLVTVWPVLLLRMLLVKHLRMAPWLLLLLTLVLPLLQQLLILLRLVDDGKVLLPLLVGEANVEDRVAFRHDTEPVLTVQVGVDERTCILVVLLPFAIQVENSFERLLPRHVLDEAAATELLALVSEEVKLLDFAESLEQLGDLVLAQLLRDVGAVQL